MQTQPQTQPQNRPEMILFDYGHTLVYESGFNILRGINAVMARATANPRNLTAEEINSYAQTYLADFGPQFFAANVELHEWQYQRLLYESLQISFDITPAELERLFWYNASPGAVVPGAQEMLAYLKESGIRTGVVSNLMFSGQALQQRLNRLLPDNDFEFIITSSEYLVKKPSPLLFNLALSKANLPKEAVWHCGHSPEVDVQGAANAGIFPIWFRYTAIENPRLEQLMEAPSCPHRLIHHWSELIDLLED
ncbi:MAG: HAD family hydrolase [Oscillospiraceae bacterium]|jgi:putative hydrolase of the HAD superfamily|nr:HAD family hydrolase [Oscillospiraceae bacterium]